MRRIPVMLLLGVLAVTVACTNKKVSNPIANVDSKQPDKVLFDRAMDAMKHNRFDVARLSLQTLINTYPDSEYIARAKLAVADSWYAEGGWTLLLPAAVVSSRDRAPGISGRQVSALQQSRRSSVPAWAVV
jgi:outer membrane protein assembly factor BamD (BamD/ComL family)